jgi:hypothetical protein
VKAKQTYIESKNVHLGLCTNEFNSFGSFIVTYSYWPMILKVYNLSHGMCMRLEFMFFSTVIQVLNRTGRNIDDCLCPLIDELKQL